MAGRRESLRTSCWFELGFVTDGQAMTEDVMEREEQEASTPTSGFGNAPEEGMFGEPDFGYICDGGSNLQG